MCCLKHEVGDFDPIPGNVMKRIRDFAETKFVPAVLDYFEDIIPEYRENSLEEVKEIGFYVPSYEDGRIARETAYDLHNLNVTDLILADPDAVYRKLDGKRAIGSVIRICKAINKQKLADEVYRIVHKCFIPDEHQDPKDPNRFLFGLNVEPSTGEIQCDCCKKN